MTGTATWMQMGGLGGLLMLAFAIGQVIPVTVGAASIVWLKNMQSVGRWRRAFEILGHLNGGRRLSAQ